MFARIRLSLMVIVAGCLLPGVVWCAPAGKITKFSGSVFYREKNNIPYAAITAAIELSEGNWVKTGKDGWLELTLSDNSRFTIANNSEMEIAGFMVSRKKKTGTFNLIQGKLRASVIKLAGQQTALTVKSATAVAGIKGTEFLMLAQGPANVFFGNEGTVNVSGQGKEGRQLIPRAMTQNTRGYTPIEPVMVEPGTPLAQARSSFEQITAATPPAEWMEADNLPNIIARWNINYGRYLADSGKYDAALHVFQIALDLTNIPDTRCDARLERGSVYSRFLANPEAAMSEYLLVLEEYPASRQADTALFTVGQTLVEMDFKEGAKARFKEYLRLYPNGRYKSSVETLLNRLEK